MAGQSPRKAAVRAVRQCSENRLGGAFVVRGIPVSNELAGAPAKAILPVVASLAAAWLLGRCRGKPDESTLLPEYYP